MIRNIINVSLLCTFALLAILSSCTKEVKIDIPGFEEQLVVDGQIHADGFPVVLLSRSQNIYAATDLSAYLESFISDATVSVSDGTVTVPLQVYSIADLPLETQKRVAEMLSLELNEVVFVPILVYSTTDPNMVGQVGKTYELNIQYQGKTYTGSTDLLQPVALDNVYWKPDVDNPMYGSCWARLSDPAGVYNAYRWERKIINTQTNGQPKDVIFRHSSSPYFDDEFFDGVTFEFETRYPKPDTTYPDGYHRYYKLGDTVVIKFSRVDKDVYTFFDKKDAQISSAGNPFSTPVNAPSNISGGALGIWAGISPWFDTLICVP
jgi:hypothetical protein